MQEQLARLHMEAVIRESRGLRTQGDPWHKKRRKYKRGNSPRAKWKAVMRMRAENNYNRLQMVEQALLRGGFKYRDFMRAINRKEAMQLNSMVLWLKQQLPDFEAMVYGAKQ